MTPTTILDLASRHYAYPGARDEAIRRELGMTPAQFSAALSAALDDPASLEINAPVVRRLQRLRGRRQAQRSAARLDRSDFRTAR